MAVLDIYEYGAEILRIKATPVEEVTEDFAILAENMIQTMYDAKGIGLAAPQIGKSVRLIVVDVSGPEENENPVIIFNPEVTHEAEPEFYEEGCLSVPGIYANVERPAIISITGLDIDGDPIKFDKIDGLFARCILHEIDHLNGVLFVDYLNDEDKEKYEKELVKMAKLSQAKK